MRNTDNTIALQVKKWYYVPPYRNEGHIVLDQNGELIANFEIKEDAELVIELYNKYHGN